METKGIYSKYDNQPGTVPSSSTAPLSTKQTREEMRNVQDHFKSTGIKDWEILNAWSEIAQEQGNYAAADTRFFCCL